MMMMMMIQFFIYLHAYSAAQRPIIEYLKHEQKKETKQTRTHKQKKNKELITIIILLFIYLFACFLNSRWQITNKEN
jgi:amino acid permease